MGGHDPWEGAAVEATPPPPPEEATAPWPASPAVSSPAASAGVHLIHLSLTSFVAWHPLLKFLSSCRWDPTDEVALTLCPAWQMETKGVPLLESGFG